MDMRAVGLLYFPQGFPCNSCDALYDPYETEHNPRGYCKRCIASADATTLSIRQIHPGPFRWWYAEGLGVYLQHRSHQSRAEIVLMSAEEAAGEARYANAVVSVTPEWAQLADDEYAIDTFHGNKDTARGVDVLQLLVEGGVLHPPHRFIRIDESEEWGFPVCRLRVGVL